MLDKIKLHFKSKEFFEFFRNLFLLFTAIFFATNIIIIYGFGKNPDITFTSFTFTILSLTIACHAVIIAIESDNKMKSLAEMQFVEKKAMIHKYNIDYTNIKDFSKETVIDKTKACISDLQSALKVQQWVADDKTREDFNKAVRELKKSFNKDEVQNLIPKMDRDEFEKAVNEILN